MSMPNGKGGLQTYDPIDLRRHLMEQEVMITRAICALDLVTAALRHVHTESDHHRTAAQLRAAAATTLNAITSLGELAGCYELLAQLESVSA